MTTADTVYILKIVEVIAFAVGFFLLVLTLINKTEEKFKKVRQRVASSYAKKTQKKYVSDFIDTQWAEKIDENYKYSRFFKKPVSNFLKTSIGYFITSIIVSIIVMIVIYIITKSPLGSLVGLCVCFVGSIFYLYILRYNNNKNVEGDLITFLNLLGNYSTGNTEVMSIFLQIAPKVQEPLRSCLIECVNESYNSEENTEKVLRNLENKIECPDFKEIVENIIVSIKYSSGFVTLCNNERKILSISLVGKKTIKACVQNNTRIMLICLILLMCMMFPLGGLLNIDVVQQTLTTLVGRFYIFMVAVCVLIYLIDLLKVEK